jgi:hypothetical protein
MRGDGCCLASADRVCSCPNCPRFGFARICLGLPKATSPVILAKVYHYNGPGQGLILLSIALSGLWCAVSLFRSFARQGRRDADRRRKDAESDT